MSTTKPNDATLVWLNERGYFIALFPREDGVQAGQHTTMIDGTPVFVLGECPPEELAELRERFPLRPGVREIDYDMCQPFRVRTD